MPAGACTPGKTETDVGHCANGGWRDRVRSCNSNCSWGAWTDTSACQYGQNACTGCACVSWCKDPKTNGGSTCLWIGCSEADARAECQADLKDNCGTTNQPLTFTDWRPN